MLKAFPIYSKRYLYCLVNDDLHRFDIEVLKTFKRDKSKRPTPSEKFYSSKQPITDFAQCDESNIAILLNSVSIAVIDHFAKSIVYHIDGEFKEVQRFLILPPPLFFDPATFPVVLCTNNHSLEVLDLSKTGIKGKVDFMADLFLHQMVQKDKTHLLGLSTSGQLFECHLHLN